MDVARAGRGSRRRELLDQFLALDRVHAFDRISVRSEIKRAAAIDRVFPDHAPTLRRQRRKLFGGGQALGDLAARMPVMMPGEGIFQLFARCRVEPLESEPRRDEFGFAAVLRNGSSGKNGSERRHAFERTVGMPKLIGLVAHGIAVIRRHDFAVRTDRRENDEMRSGAERADLGGFRRPEAA